MRSHVLLVISVLAVICLTGCKAAAQGAAQLNQAANRLYAGHDFNQALETYRRAEVLRPDLPALNYNAANTLNQQNDFQRAIDEAGRAVHSTDADLQDRAYYSMANAYVRTNQLREAVDAYKSALRVDPTDADAKYNLEVIERRLGNNASASQQSQAGDSGQASQQNQSEASQAGQQADGQAQSAAQGQGQPAEAQSGQPSGPATTGAANGYTGTPEGQAAALDPDLKQAIDQFNRTGNVDDALRALDIAQQQERLQQSAGEGDTPQPQGKDW